MEGSTLAIAKLRAFFAGTLQIFRCRRQVNNLARRCERLLLAALGVKALERGLVGLQRFPFVALLDELGVIESLLRRGRDDFRQLLVGNAAFRAFTRSDFLVEKIAQQCSRFIVAAQAHTEISGRLPDLLVVRIIFQNAEILLQGSFGLGPLQIFLGFFESLGDVRHWQSPQRALGGGNRDPAKRLKVCPFYAEIASGSTLPQVEGRSLRHVAPFGKRRPHPI